MYRVKPFVLGKHLIVAPATREREEEEVVHCILDEKKKNEAHSLYSRYCS